MTRHPFVRPIVVSGLVALALVMTGCGGSTKTATAATTTTTVAANGANRLAAFRACMQTHGVTLPANARIGGRGFGGGPGTTDATGATTPAPTTTIPAGVTEQQWQAAITACASTLPNRPNLQNNPQVQLYFNCLNSYLSTHGGTTLPPLGQGGTGGLFGGGRASGNTTTTNPTLQAAQAHCAALRPALGGRGTTTTTSIG